MQPSGERNGIVRVRKHGILRGSIHWTRSAVPQDAGRGTLLCTSVQVGNPELTQ